MSYHILFAWTAVMNADPLKTQSHSSVSLCASFLLMKLFKQRPAPVT